MVWEHVLRCGQESMELPCSRGCRSSLRGCRFTHLFHGRWKEEGLRPGAAAPCLAAPPRACIISLLPEASGESLRAAPPHSAGLWEIWVLVLAGVCQAVPTAPVQVQILPPALTRQNQGPEL